MSTQAPRTYRADQFWVRDSRGRLICVAESEADAENIATALNCHDELLAALDACNDAFCCWQIGAVPGRPEDILALIGKVRSAIAKARGEA